MLSNIPCMFKEHDLNQVLSSFGEVRAIHHQANVSNEDEEGNKLTLYLVEFFDIQDARRALLELEHTHSWGDCVKIKVGARSPMQRLLGKDLVLLISNWLSYANGRSNTSNANPPLGSSLGDGRPMSSSKSLGKYCMFESCTRYRQTGCYRYCITHHCSLNNQHIDPEKKCYGICGKHRKKGNSQLQCGGGEIKKDDCALNAHSPFLQDPSLHTNGRKQQAHQ